MVESSPVTVEERLDEEVNQYLDIKLSVEAVEQLNEDIAEQFGIGIDKWRVREETGFVQYNLIEVILPTSQGDEVFLEFRTDKDGTLIEVSRYYEAFIEFMGYMNCPACGTGYLEHRPVPSNTWREDGITHVYVCTECPIVAMEYYDDYDAEAFGRAIR